MRKNIIPITITTITLGTILFCVNTSAISYQSSNNIQFNINPTISISISGDSNGNLSIANLVPGSVSDSNAIDVTVSSNAVSGYTLTSTVGTSTNTSNELRKDGTDTNNKFTSLNSNQSSLNDFNDNEWGYSYSTDNGTTWISGDVSNPSTGYNSYTYNTSTSTSSIVTHLDTSTPSSSTIKYKIGAKASNTQLAGEYTNTINFTAIAKPNPAIRTLEDATYMQDDFSCLATPEGTTKTLIDRRDNNTYDVRKINGLCWMIQNLRITGTISAEYSNFTGEDFNVSEYSLDKNDPTYTDHCDSTNGYNYACSKDSNSNITGVWYNYAAATAGTITGNDSNTIEATNSICPAGWHLPSGPNTIVNTDYNKLAGNTTSGWQKLTSGLTAFGVATGGGYYDGSCLYTGLGIWWSATTSSDTGRYDLGYNSSDNTFQGSGETGRRRGLFVRCVRSI